MGVSHRVDRRAGPQGTAAAVARPQVKASHYAARTARTHGLSNGRRVSSTPAPAPASIGLCQQKASASPAEGGGREGLHVFVRAAGRRRQ